jgi:hypothetical protein
VRLRWSAVILGVLILGLTSIHPEISLQGKIYASADAKAAAAFTALGQIAREQGELPLWNPFVFAGMPSYASLAYLPDVYPVTKPLRLLVDNLSLPPMSWLLLHLLLLGAGTAFYLRSKGIPLVPCVAAGLWVMALPKLTAWGVYGHGTKLGTIAWLPWTLWCLEELFRRPRLRVAMLLAALWSMQLLRHHVQLFYYCALICLCVTISELVARRLLRRPAGLRWSSLGWITGAAVLALCAASVIYLPVWEYQAQSIRGAASQDEGAAYDYATNWSLAPAELGTLVWPAAFGYGGGSYVGSMPFTDYPNYIGAPLLLLGVVGFASRRDRWAWCWMSLFVLSTLLSFGRHGGLYDLFYNVAPFFKKFRVPAMILIVQELAVVFLAAAGLGRVFELLRVGARRWRLASLLLAVAGLMLLLFGSVGVSVLESQHLAHWRNLRQGMPTEALRPALDIARGDALRLGFVCLIAALVFSPWVGRIRADVRASVVVLLLSYDLVAVGRPLQHPEDYLTRPARSASGVVWTPSPPMIRDQDVVKSYVAASELSTWLRGQEERPRVWPIGVPERSRDNELAAQRVVNLGGYHAAKLKNYEEIRRRIFEAQPPAVALVNMLHGEWVLVQDRLPESTLATLATLGMQLDPEPAYSEAGSVLYRNRSALPRAWLVGAFELERQGADLRAESPDPSILERLNGDPDAIRTRAILPATPHNTLGPAAANGTVSVEDTGFDSLRLEVSTEDNAILVLADPYYPGWTARLDGREAEILRANYALRSVEIPAGEHLLEMEFSGGSYALGRSVARVSWSVMILAAAVGMILERRRTPTGSPA